MKCMLIVTCFVALAVASPVHRSLVTPGVAGPAPAPEYENIAVGPAILDFEPIAVGPAVVDSSPISVGPAMIDSFEPIAVAPAPVIVAEEAQNAATPFVEIILNINGATHVINAPIPAPIPAPVQITESAAVPVQTTEDVSTPIQVIEIAPAEIAAPVLPTPAVPQPIAIGTPALPNPVPEPIAVGTPVLPNPAIVLPENLN